MTHAGRHIPEGVPAFARTLLSRCETLALPAWFLDEEGTLFTPGHANSDVSSLFASDAIGDVVRGVVDSNRCAHREIHVRAEPVEGIVFVVVPSRNGRRVVGHVVIGIVRSHAMSGAEFESICEAAGVNSGTVTEALRPTIFLNDARADSAISGVEWMAEDLARSQHLERDIESFGRQLTDSYEEIALLYKLREGISAEANPVHFVDEACRDLLAVIPYSWLGVCFSRERREARALAGETVLFGASPCSKERFRYSVDLMAHALTPGTPRVLTGEERGSFTDGSSQVAVVPFGKQGTIVGTIVAGGKTNNDDTVTSIDMKMLEAVAGHMLVLIENAGLYAEQRDTFLGTLQALTTAIDAKDRYTCGHSERVAFLSEQLALASGLSPHDAERIRISGLVHDVGKIGVPERVLGKPGKLTDDEYDQIKLHPEIGHAILRDIPTLEDVLPGVLYHHERYDGRGYPFGLAGEEIPTMARVIGLADAFDAMSSSRTYRTAMPRSRVLSEIERGAGTQFDPALAERFLAIDLYAYDEMVARHHAQANGGRQEKAA